MGPNEYRFLLKGNPVGQGELRPGHWLAMNASKSKVVLKGVPTIEPVFQLPATWITDAERKNGRGGRVHGGGRALGAGHPPERDGPAPEP